MSRSSCPTPVELEQASFGAHPEVLEHALSCERCRPVISEVQALRKLAASLPASTGDPRELERVRNALTTLPRRPRAAPSRLGWAVGLAAGLAVIAGVWAARVGPLSEPVHRAQVRADAGARFQRLSAQPDELLRLEDGQIFLTVDFLGAGERFRARCDDAEIEVQGAALALEVVGGRLHALRVLSGRAELRLQGAPAQAIEAGEAWPFAPTTSAALVAPGAGPDLEPAAPTSAVTKAAPRPPPRRPTVKAPTTPAAEPAPPPPSPQKADAWEPYQAGWAAMRGADFRAAAIQFGRATELASDPELHEDAHFYWGVALARAGEGTAAEEVLGAWQQLHPNSPRVGEVAAMLGWIALDRGDRDRARRSFEQAVRSGAASAIASGNSGLTTLANTGSSTTAR